MLPIVPILTGVSDGVIPYVGDRFRRKMLDPSVVIASTKVASADFDMTASLKALMDPKPYLEKMTQDILTGRRHADDYHLTRRVDNETARLEELRLEGFLEQVRVTIGQTLFECAHPDERAVPDDIQHRLAQTLRLIWWHEKLDDMMHDLGFDHRSATLQVWFDDLQRGRDRL
jgi:hypothetical protein